MGLASQNGKAFLMTLCVGNTAHSEFAIIRVAFSRRAANPANTKEAPSHEGAFCIPTGDADATLP